MKHPLTSKERRGLVAVAAAALLCIGSGFIFRSCSSQGTPTSNVTVIGNDSIAAQTIDSVSGKSRKSSQSGKSGESAKSKKSGKSKKSKSPKSYPSRSPLDQPINQ